MLPVLSRAVRAVPGARRAALVLRFGDARRTRPLSDWGSSRGTAVDRWYIARFLDQRADLVRGLVLEVKQDQYASRLGAERVEVVDIDADNPLADVVGDLCDPAALQPGRYDAAVVTQTLQLLVDPAAALRHLLASLRPGGVLLLTVPCLSRLCGPGDRWRWTPEGLSTLLEQVVPEGAEVEVVGTGNSLAGRAFLFGLAAEELDDATLAVEDPVHPLVVGACVRLPDGG